MGETSKIEWTDATWNPWQGCTKISPACEHCYMFTDMKRYGRDGAVVVRSKPATFDLPLKKKRGNEYAIAPGSKVFTCSWSDWFHASADPWRDEAWEIIRQRPDVTFQIVTKRVGRICFCLPDVGWPDDFRHVQIIATTEDQEWFDKRIPLLRMNGCAVRGLSIEPMLGPINLGFEPHPGMASIAEIERWERDRIGWVIVGGESGPGARPMHPAWVRSVRDQCQAAAVPFFFKQWGDWLPWDDASLADRGSKPVVEIAGPDRMVRVGKKAAGRVLDGRIWSEFPKQLETAI